jgi:Holliday junction resolvase RusA-like endonuclease
MTIILIPDLPMPPSANELYRNVMGVGRVATKELKDYKSAMKRWAFANNYLVREIADVVAKWRFIDVSANFHFRHSRIITLDGRAKKIDTSNRLKALHDSLAEALGIDDKVFWNVHAKKLVLREETMTEHVDIYLEQIVQVARPKSGLMPSTVGRKAGRRTTASAMILP